MARLGDEGDGGDGGDGEMGEMEGEDKLFGI